MFYTKPQCSLLASSNKYSNNVPAVPAESLLWPTPPTTHVRAFEENFSVRIDLIWSLALGNLTSLEGPQA